MGKLTWKEAEPQRGWPKRGAEWPTDAEYIALRHAKHLWDTVGPNQSWCTCTANCSHGDKQWAVHFVEREMAANGHAKWAGVKTANNRYGYESIIYATCNQVEKTEFLMRWDGVPLKDVVHEVRHAPEVKPADPFKGHVIAPGGRFTVRRQA